MKKIMLQGYLQTSNFGDVLFAHLFYKKLLKEGYEVDFFQYKNVGIGSHCREELGYSTKLGTLECLRADALVIISGGSLWDDGKSKQDAKIRFLRFVLPARLYELMGKPVYLLGVGGGPVETPWLRRQMVKMLNGAKVIRFRDAATKKVFEDYHVRNHMEVTADTALVIRPDMLDPLEEGEELEAVAKGRKKILLHLPDGTRQNENLAKRVVPGLVHFCKDHPEYMVVVSHDNVREMNDKEALAIDETLKQLNEAGIDLYHYHYHDSWQMCSLINEMDCVITAKLHVGVIACVCGKAVVSFPVHREKTQNYYEMIQEEERCLHMNQTSPSLAYEQICRFHDKPVKISEDMISAAKENLWFPL